MILFPKPYALAGVFFLLLLSKMTFACTGFGLCFDGHFVFVRNTDIGTADVALVRNGTGVSRTAFLVDPDEVSYRPSKLKPLQWISKYRSLTFNHVAAGFPNEGMNEKGLIIAPFSLLPDRRYRGGSEPKVNEWQWIQYHLDMHATVDEVTKSLKNIRINRLVENAIHLLVCDRNECVAIEPNENGFEVHNITEFPVIANDRYPDIMRAYRETTWNEVNSAFISSSRFLFAAKAIMEKFDWEQGAGRDYAFSQLNQVSQEFTDYQTIFDPTAGEIYFRRFSKKSVSVAMQVPVIGDLGIYEIPPKIENGVRPNFVADRSAFICDQLLSGNKISAETIEKLKMQLDGSKK